MCGLDLYSECFGSERGLSVAVVPEPRLLRFFLPRDTLYFLPFDSSIGGLGDAVCSAVAMTGNIRVKKLAVTGLPRSGQPNELIDLFGISAGHIVKAVKEGW